MDWLRLRGVPPSPMVYWNHRVSVKSPNNPWGTVTCRQNLDVKELRSRVSLTNSHDGSNAISAHRPGLGDDRRLRLQTQGWMSQTGCGKTENMPWVMPWKSGPS